MPFFTDDDWKDILKGAGTSELRLDLHEAGIQVMRGFGDGLGKMFKEILKKLGGETSK